MSAFRVNSNAINAGHMSIRMGQPNSNTPFSNVLSTLVFGTQIGNQEYGIQFDNFNSNADSGRINYLYNDGVSTKSVNIVEINSLADGGLKRAVNAELVSVSSLWATSLLSTNRLMASNIIATSMTVNSLNVGTIYASAVETVAGFTLGENQAPGSTGPFGSSESLFGLSIANWLQRYLINPPNAPTNSSTSNNSSEVIITWKPPNVSSFGFTNMALPATTALNVNIEDSGTYNNVVSLTPSIYLPSYTKTPISSFTVRRANATNQASALGTRNGQSSYIFYPPQNITLAAPVKLRVWYANYNTDVPVNSTIFSNLSFAALTKPVAPTLLAGTITFNSVVLTPVAGVNADPSAPRIANFTVTHTPASTRRYGGLFSSSPATNTVTTAYTASNLYPDVTYNVSLFDTDEFGTVSDTVSCNALFTTTNFTNTFSNVSNTVLSNAFASATKYDALGSIFVGNTAITNVYYQPGTLTLSPIGPLSVHNLAGRSGTATNQMTLTGTINATTSFFTTNGFPASATPSATASASNGQVKLAPGATTDQYVGTSNAGFYLIQSFTPSLTAPASATQQTLAITQTFADITSNTGSYSIYLDNLNTTLSPTISAAGVAISGTTTQICGTTVYGQTFNVTASNVSYTNLSTRFTVSDTLLLTMYNSGSANSPSYTLVGNCGNPVQATLLSNNVTTQSVSVTDEYVLNPTARLTLKNTNFRTGTRDVALTARIDTATTTLNSGLQRMVTPANFTATSFRSAFNNGVTLPAGELFIDRGRFVALANTIYTSLSISGTQTGLTSRFGLTSTYQFVTLQFPISGSVNYTQFTLTINDFTGSLALTTTAPTNGTRNQLTVDGSLLACWYKIEPTGGQNTRWFEGNSDINGGLIATYATDGNTSATVVGGLKSNPTTSGASASFNCSVYPTVQGVNGGSIYVLVGIPTTLTTGFGSVSLSLAE